MLNRRIDRDDVESFELNEDTPDEPKTIQEIVLREIRKIGDISAEELIEGYWKKKPIHTAGGITFVEEYIKDTRKAYCGAVDFIIDLVFPSSDDGFKKKIEEFDAKEYKDIEEEIKYKKNLFREINIMFDRVGFFKDKLVKNY